MNEPIINPWLIYLAGISDSVVFFCIFWAILLSVVVFIEIIARLSYPVNRKEDDKPVKRWHLVVTSIAMMILFMAGILIPGQDTMFKIIAAKNITPANISKVIVTGTVVKDDLKKDIIEIIQEIKK